MTTISAQCTKGDNAGKSVSVDVDFGSNITEAMEKFGEATCFNHLTASLTVALQGWLRSQIKQGKTPEEISTAASTWKPGQRRQGKSPQEKLKEQLEKMSPEERAALLKEYTGKNK